MTLRRPIAFALGRPYAVRLFSLVYPALVFPIESTALRLAQRAVLPFVLAVSLL